MKEVLFRGKSVVTGDWIYGVPVSNDYITCIFKLIDGLGELKGFQVKPETVGQCTGLTDKNGTKIFEGDIIEYEEQYGIARYSVAYRNKSACFCVKSCNDIIMGDFTFYDSKKCKVIGNVYDNPELLVGESK